MRELAAQDGYAELKYLIECQRSGCNPTAELSDESGFCLWSPVSYSYSRVNEQKRLERFSQAWEPRYLFWDCGNLTNGLSTPKPQGGFDGESYIQVMDWLADKAAITLFADRALNRGCASLWLKTPSGS